MFLPYADEAPREGRIPWMNWILILSNVAIFLNFGLRPDYDVLVAKYGFTPSDPRPITLFTSMFLHGDFMHLIGNMWFLYLFGDNVESRCGPFKYLFAYLIAGLAGDLSHAMFFSKSTVPSIGASGAIFGVEGMYLFLFPHNRIKVFYFVFVFIGTTVVRAVWVIGMFFGLELLYSRLQTMSGAESGIGHLAHAGGFVGGFVMALFYQIMGLVRNERTDVLSHVTGKGVRHPEPGAITTVDARMMDDTPLPPGAFRANDPRFEIVRLLHSGRADEARKLWRRYAFDNHDGVLPAREQLEVALALDKHGERGIARDAYERLLANFPNEQPYAAEANLALAGMLLQELKESGDEREVPLIERLLRRTIESHPISQRRELAQRWLSALGSTS
jgi:membrane associated rhomboid family serine protease